MSTEIYTVLIVAAAVICLICVAVMYHADKDSELGRELREAAGSESAARMAIESANLDRLLSKKFEGEYGRAMRKPPRNVVPLRIVNRGQPVRFEPPGAA